MFSCFFSNKSTKTKSQLKEEKEKKEKIEKLKNQIDILSSENRSLSEKNNIYSQLSNVYRDLSLNSRNWESSSNADLLISQIKKENNTLNHTFEILSREFNCLKAEHQELCLSFENIFDENCRTDQNKNLIFELENVLLKRQNEIFSLEKELNKINEGTEEAICQEIHVKNRGESQINSNMKNYSSDDDSKLEDDGMLRKLLYDDLESKRNKFQKVSKQIIAEKKILNQNLKMKEDLINQIKELKEPKFETDVICLDNCLPEKFERQTTLTTKPSTHKLDEKKIYEKNQEELAEEVDKNISTLRYLKNELEEEKRRKLKFEKDIYNLSNYLSDKFSLIFKLEIRLEKMKIKRSAKPIHI